jgi:membrane-associated protease RseP (regulator of RpoE activity)
MDQQFYFPNPRTGTTPEAEPEESHRSTVIHRFPPPKHAGELVQREQTGRLAMKEITTSRLLVNLLFLALTIITTAGVGSLWFYNSQAPIMRAIELGLVYSFTLIVILAAHELGHYIACQWYGVNATLPYFIPMPIPPVGTFGAFIKIKSPIPTRRALFDIGIAGPLAGFVFVIPAAFIAHYFAQAAGEPTVGSGIYFQDPLLFKIFQYLFQLPPVIEMNPVLWAAWIGAFMTSLNLLPVGQLDGGHITFAIFGRQGHRAIAIICYLAVIGLALYTIRGGTWNWVVYAVILTLMLRVGHPPVVDDRQPLGTARSLIAVIGLIVFILSFMPFPIRIVE